MNPILLLFTYISSALILGCHGYNSSKKNTATVCMTSCKGQTHAVFSVDDVWVSKAKAAASDEVTKDLVEDFARKHPDSRIYPCDPKASCPLLITEFKDISGNGTPALFLTISINSEQGSNGYVLIKSGNFWNVIFATETPVYGKLDDSLFQYFEVFPKCYGFFTEEKGGGSGEWSAHRQYYRYLNGCIIQALDLPTESIGWVDHDSPHFLYDIELESCEVVCNQMQCNYSVSFEPSSNLKKAAKIHSFCNFKTNFKITYILGHDSSYHPIDKDIHSLPLTCALESDDDLALIKPLFLQPGNIHLTSRNKLANTKLCQYFKKNNFN